MCRCSGVQGRRVEEWRGAAVLVCRDAGVDWVQGCRKAGVQDAGLQGAGFQGAWGAGVHGCIGRIGCGCASVSVWRDVGM